MADRTANAAVRRFIGGFSLLRPDRLEKFAHIYADCESKSARLLVCPPFVDHPNHALNLPRGLSHSVDGYPHDTLDRAHRTAFAEHLESLATSGERELMHAPIMACLSVSNKHFIPSDAN